MKYFEEYRKCRCVSGMVKSKSELPGYCEKHGTDRARIHESSPITAEQRSELFRRGLENYPNTEEYKRFYKDNKIGMDG